MIKFHTIGQIEHKYAFKDAVTMKDVLNGDFGKVADEKFTAGEGALEAIMQLETGDDMYMDEYKISADSHVRVLDLSAYKDEFLEIYGAQLPATYTKGDKLVSTAEGKLIVNAAATAPYFKIETVIGNKQGVIVKIVTE